MIVFQTLPWIIWDGKIRVNDLLVISLVLNWNFRPLPQAGILCSFRNIPIVNFFYV